MPGSSTLIASLTPSGHVALSRVQAESHPLPPEVLGRIEQAFARSTGHGLLWLGAAELGAPLAPTLSWWRELGRQVVASSCALADPLDSATVHSPAAPAPALSSLAARVPPMRGAERITPALLEALVAETASALAERASETEGGLQGFLARCDPVWNLAGRVCLHLAENKRDPRRPFAFLATYARQVPGRQRVQHVPLGRALQEYAGARQRQELAALLTPLRRAAEHSPQIAGMIERGEVYHPLAWTAAQAHAFLQEAEVFERAGLVLRLPDWWKARRRSGPVVSVTLGDDKPSALGLDALLDFRVELTLGGEPLSEAEIEALLGASTGLLLLKGRWVEVDPERLGQVLDQWREVQAQALEQTDGMERRGIVLAFLTRFKQICDHPSLWLGDQGFEAGSSGKLARLTELCEPIAERQEKVLVFTQFRSMCEPLQRHLEACFGLPGLVLHGGTRVKRRQELVDRFQQDDRVPFMVLSLKAGGTGLNLTAANHVVHFDRWWNPAVENQATDRAFRIGQQRNVLVHKFVCRGTVEERIDELIAGKRELAEQVLASGAEVKLTELSNRELLDMVHLDLDRAVST